MSYSTLREGSSWRNKSWCQRPSRFTRSPESIPDHISLEGTFDLGIISPDVARIGKKSIISVKSTSVKGRHDMIEAEFASRYAVRGIRHCGFEITRESGPIIPTAKESIVLVVEFKQKYPGHYYDRLQLLFEDIQTKKRFFISQDMKAVVADEEQYVSFKPTAPYAPKPKINRQVAEDIVKGVRPPAMNAICYVVQLPHAFRPDDLYRTLSKRASNVAIIKALREDFLPGPLGFENHSQFMKHLLWIEEVKMAQDLERYDIQDAELTRHNNYYFLPVPGLAEKRPSVLVGDRFLVQEQGRSSTQWYEGHVHVVRQAEVGLCFRSSFGKHHDGRRLYVRFKLTRIPLRRQHQALDLEFSEERLFFPLPSHLLKISVPKPKDVSLKLYNFSIANNEAQLQAISSIALLPSGSIPFIVFGPPGTGKTVTIVESMLQVLAFNPSARILAYAPSNSAADIIASRLIPHLSPDELFRFYAPSRSKETVSSALMKYTYTDKDGHFSVPPPARTRLKRFRVVITTCLSASVLYGTGMPRGHFTHIFVDEAGQATEPEVLVGIKTMADAKTNVIISGDPKQLGPIVRSGVARGLGMEVSLLERLMEREVYNLKKGYGRSIVKLVKNFRSHESILSFPNSKFYDNDLLVYANPALIDHYLDSPYLPAKDFPIVFHSVSGRDDREASSPSFFNIDEILVVKSYVQKLKSDRKFRTADADIGVISPYHAQCLKLRTALRNVADNVKVGSVEEFQGQERKVIIISTVRSSPDFVEYDLRHTLGFVASPRRFNVAITRAQAMLIVVGDPAVLSLDPLWRSFLYYVHKYGGWEGPEIDWEPEDLANVKTPHRDLDMNKFTRKIESLTLDNARERDGGLKEREEVEEDIDANVDRPWRDLE